MMKNTLTFKTKATCGLKNAERLVVKCKYMEKDINYPMIHYNCQCTVIEANDDDD